jgi:non-specific protein-tyrosine kinase
MEIPMVETEVEGLAVLPCGVLPPNPADILSSSRMARLITTLTSQADFVVFDAPPVLVAMDAIALATKTDGLLLVVRSGHTRRDKLEQAKQLLSRSDVRLLGAVLTDSPERGMWTGY